MAISFVGAGTVVSSSSLIGTTGLALTPNASTLTDDLMIAFMHRNQDDGSYDEPIASGWTTWATESTSGGQDMQTHIAYKKATSDSEGTATFTHSDTTGEQWAGVILTFRGQDLTTPIDTAYVSATHFTALQNKASPNVDAFDTINVTTDQACVVALEAVTHDDITSDADPANYTNAVRNIGGAQDFRQFQVWYRLGLSTGNETPGAPAYTSNAAVAESHQYTIAIRPAAASETADPLLGELDLLGILPTVAVANVVKPTVGAINIYKYVGLKLDGIPPTIDVAGGGDNPENPLLGELDLLGYAPTAVVAETELPSLTALVLDTAGLDPTAVVGNVTAPTVGALTLDTAGLDPTAVVANVTLPTVGALALDTTGLDPTASVGEVELPLLGTLTVAEQTPTTQHNRLADVPVGSLTLAGLDPVGSVGNVTGPTTDALVLGTAGLDPAASIGEVTLPTVGGLALGVAGNDPSTQHNRLAGVPVGSLALGVAGLDPVGAVTLLTGPTVGALTLSTAGLDPTAVAGLVEAPDAGSLALEGQIPTLGTYDIPEDPGVGSLALAGQAPTTVVGNVVKPTVGALTLASTEPDALTGASPSPALDTLALAGQTPVTVVSNVVAPGVGSLTLGMQTPSLPGQIAIEVPVGGINIYKYVGLKLDGIPPSIAVEKDITAGVGALTLAGQTPTPVEAGAEAPGLGTLALSGQTPTTVVGSIAAPTVGSLVINGQTIVDQDIVSPAVGALTLGVQTPTLKGDIVVPTGSLRIYEFVGLELCGQSVTIQHNRVAAPAAGSLSFSTEQPNISVGAELTIIVDPGSLTLAGAASSADIARVTDPALGALALAGKSPVTDISVFPGKGRMYITAGGHIPEPAGLALSGQPVSIFYRTGTFIENPNASTSEASNYEQCDYTGFRQMPGSLKLTWNKYAVRRKSWESRHPQEYVRSSSDKQKGSKRPEQPDRFIGTDIDEVDGGDL